jgi:hypothetical protein
MFGYRFAVVMTQAKATPSSSWLSTSSSPCIEAKRLHRDRGKRFGIIEFRHFPGDPPNIS